MELSVLIPSRDEKHLHKTISSVLENSEAQVIVGLDGWTQDTDIFDSPRVEWVHLEESIGQRAMTNKLARLSKAKYIMKVDAHCIFSKDFDKKMISKMDDRTIMSPYLLSIDEESWSVRAKPLMSEYAFDSKMVMQHLPHKTEGLIVETMCLQGSAWMISRENYWKWNVCDEDLGSWGHQGVELGIQAYLNGGRCVTNRDCYYGHLFRQDESSFPYDRGDIKTTSNKFIKRFKNKEIAGLIEKYDHPCDWTPEMVRSLG